LSHSSLQKSQLDGNAEFFFCRFPIDKIIDNSVTDFELFAEVDSHVILYSAQGYRWEREELAGLIGHGYTHLWIRPEDRAKAAIYEKMAALPHVAHNLSPEERLSQIQDVGLVFTRYLFEGEITESAVQKGRELSEQIVSCVKEDPGCVRALSGLADHDQYTYLHSVRVAAYSTAIAHEMGISDDESLKQIALGSIFHDVGKSSVSMDIINKRGPLLEHEWLAMRSHPTEGLKKLGETQLSHVCREIVVHHHERLNGSGYPHGINKDSLLFEVQIASLADIFDALTSSRSYQNKRSRYEALDFIKHRLLGTEVSSDAFKALVSCLVK
jgi:putative nucleotidyltransferase with HDIG domain